MEHPHRPNPVVTAAFQVRVIPRRDGGEMTYLRTGSGPGILLLHELPGMTPQFLDLAAHLAESGFTVYAPVLFGQIDQRLSKSEENKVCFRRDINCFSKTAASPVVHDLSRLVEQIHADTDGPVGVIGMCLTGNLPIVLAADRTVRAIVLSQPAMPFVLPLPGYSSAIGVSREDVEAAKRNTNLLIIAQRFAHDCISPQDRMDNLKRTFGDQIETHVLADPVVGAHAILTDNMDYNEGTETRAEYDRIVAVFRQKLAR